MSTSELTKLNISEAREGLRRHEFSAVELTHAYIRAIENIRHLNAYITETPEISLKAAEESDARIMNNKSLGDMDGIPYAAKDMFCTQNIKSTAGSRILNDFIPPYESTVTQNLKDSGAILLGKTNLDEFAMGSSNTTSCFGPAINPWKAFRGPRVGKDLVPGGSSGGSASAVAARACMGAIGTDTGGSIRQPASFCGIVGLKPTYGRCSRWGIVAFASSLDQAGILTRSIRDAAIMLHVMAGHDVKDSTSAQAPVPKFERYLNAKIRGLKVGIPREYKVDNLPLPIEKLWLRGIEILKEAGAKIVDISLPHTKYALATYYIIAPAEASSNLARYDGVRYGLRAPGDTPEDMYMNTRQEGFGEEVKRRILVGTYVLSAGYYDAYYVKALKVRNLIATDFKNAFEECDIMLTPTTPNTAFPIGEKADDPLEMYLNDIFTVPVSLAGLPAVSVPIDIDEDGLPLGLQLIGRPFDEKTLLKVAQKLECGAGFYAMPKA